MLWESLRGEKLNGLKFRRQHPVHIYIADFYCHRLRLIIEVDGGYHLKKEQKLQDTNRTEELKNLGVHILRFTNEEVLLQKEQVLNKILSFAEKYSTD